jgi:hypothetical protein
MDERTYLKNILISTRTIATVGLSSNPAKESHEIARYLQAQGYRLFPVNPTATEILGEKVYPDLLAIPEPVDVVQIFRPSEEVMPVVLQAIQIQARVVWMQAGIFNEAAAKEARAANLKVVQNQCMRAMHRLLIGARLTPG